MSNSFDQEQQRLLLLRAIRHAHISLNDLWICYFGIGGDAGEYEVEAYLHGSFMLPPLQRDLLAHAANELIDEQPPPPRAPYSTDADGADATQERAAATSGRWDGKREDSPGGERGGRSSMAGRAEIRDGGEEQDDDAVNRDPDASP